jgi:hypothetical protein
MEQEPAVTWRRTYRMQRQTLWPQLITHAQMPLLVLAVELLGTTWPALMTHAQTQLWPQLTVLPTRRMREQTQLPPPLIV